MSKRTVTYEEFGELMCKLVSELKYFNFHNDRKFEVVFGEPRGAWPLVTHLSHYLDLKVCDSIADFYGLNCLVVDDICDTGKTFERIKKMNDMDKHPCKLYFASLFYKPTSNFKPDLYIEETTQWVVFPWEKIDEQPNR